MKRRAALQLIAALGAGATVPPGALEEILAGIDRAVDRPVDVDEWESAVREYGFLINRQPVGSLINDLTADIIGIGALLKRDNAQRTDLLRISAGLSALLAIEFGDIGNRRGARLTWGTARRAADASGDRDLKVWVRAREAEEAFWFGLSPQEIGARTTEAIRISGGIPNSGLPRAYAVRASLAAERGDEATSRTTMHELSDVFEGLPDSVTSDPATFGWNEARFRWNEAYVYTLLGGPRARQAVDGALALYPPGTLGPVANLRVIDGMGMIAGREVDMGLDHTLAALQELPLSPARRRMTGQILRTLPEEARALPAARELRILTSA
ncbi:XRE family transcriptional regulator [Actinomadura chokoriensis]|uniref:XRE family transcriptional regulator n=1 Tax=Actinomadura chokoriensis TaxID=454156 RepID=A0ABV4R5U8_9ACTN